MSNYSHNLAMHCAYNTPWEMRSGQYLFNAFPVQIANAVRGTLFDPFYKNMTFHQLVDWIDNHLIFDSDGIIIAVFNNDEILWEEF